VRQTDKTHQFFQCQNVFNNINKIKLDTITVLCLNFFVSFSFSETLSIGSTLSIAKCSVPISVLFLFKLTKRWLRRDVFRQNGVLPYWLTNRELLINAVAGRLPIRTNLEKMIIIIRKNSRFLLLKNWGSWLEVNGGTDVRKTQKIDQTLNYFFK